MALLKAGPPPARLPWAWGGPVEIDPPDHRLSVNGRLVTRAVTSTATPASLFLWLCQVRRAPYSYDWIDNFGRRSPRRPDPALQDLEVGQRFMTIFTLTDFVPGESVTLRLNPGRPRRAFGAITVKYEVGRVDEGRSQLRVAMWLPPIGRRFADERRYLLAWGDLIMMRKQLLVLSRLAESTDAAATQ